MSHKKITLDIKGMHCRSCEILLEGEIEKVAGVKKVRTHYKKGVAEIEYENEPEQSELEKAVNDAGYSIGKEDKKHFLSRNPAEYLELGAAGVILLVVYLVLKSTGILGASINTGGSSGLVGVLIVGLTAGVSTCMALIGGLILGISSRHAELHPEASMAQKFRPHVFFNFGRLASFTVLGGLIGLLGSAFKLSSSVLGILTITLGFVMLFLGLKLVEIFPRLHNKNIVLPKIISRLFGLRMDIQEYSHRGALITGALTFFVPCGFTQAMQLYAVSTGSFMEGALIMGIFALGTLPGIVGIGGLTSAVKGSFARYFFKFAGLVVVLLALFNINSGWNLTGFTFAQVADWGRDQGTLTTGSVEAKIENGKQIVEMVQAANGYSPSQFTIKKDVPVVWKIRSTTQYTCAAYINMPGAGISEPLFLGENTIEFTPTKTGPMRFTCSMGMYSGSFTVVN